MKAILWLITLIFLKQESYKTYNNLFKQLVKALLYESISSCQQDNTILLKLASNNTTTVTVTSQREALPIIFRES